MKELFTAPEMEVFRFQVMDIIATSSTTQETLDEDELPDIPMNG
jgi:hypothetical protein